MTSAVNVNVRFTPLDPSYVARTLYFGFRISLGSVATQ